MRTNDRIASRKAGLRALGAGAAATLTLSLVIAPACSSGAGMGEADARPGDLPFSDLQARMAAQSLGAEITLAARLFSPLVTSSFDSQCYSIAGDSNDSDGDTIPVDATLTLDCSERFLGAQGTLTGTFSVSDTQPDAKAWAFTASEDFSVAATGPFGGMASMGSTGSITASQGGGLFGGPYDLVATILSQAQIVNVMGQEFNISNDIDWTVSFKPDLEWSAGAVPVVGVLEINGSWSVGVNARAAVATLTTPEPLTFNPNCQTLLTAGIVRAEATFENNEPAVIRLVWEGCGMPTVTYNDNP